MALFKRAGTCWSGLKRVDTGLNVQNCPYNNCACKEEVETESDGTLVRFILTGMHVPRVSCTMPPLIMYD